MYVVDYITVQLEPPDPLLFFFFFFLEVDDVPFGTEVLSEFDLTERETRAASVKA